MKYFQPTILSSSKRPELKPNETLLVQQAQVGLYENKSKLDHCQDGVCYLTSQRIIYVDSKNPLEYSVELSLHLITDIESYNGFLRSSPKIIIHIDPEIPLSSTKIEEGGSVWACPICFFSNKASSEACQLCGVKKVKTPTTTTTVAPTQSNPVDQDSSICVVCTFMNHPSMIQCEMCGADLPREVIPSTSTASITTPDVDPQVRISFRNGGQSNLLNKLKAAVNDKQWEEVTQAPVTQTSSTRKVGISGIEGRIKETTIEANETMTDAFKDLDGLMSKATEMVKLAESISNKVSKEPGNDNSELATLRNHLLSLGISSPVTRGSAGSIYHQELAKELADFLIKFITKRDDMKPLTDVYCFFNRARGVALISPEDLYKASQQFEALKLPFRTRQFPSGLIVIQSLEMDDSRAADRILKHVKEHDGFITALQLAEIENWALTVALEQLVVTERMGLLCRDEGPAGLTFYENLFLKQQ
ncbi:Vps36-domain-containing protein [Backusella circina FSU 941]|nr:Vps36-domain-containing protein [Backusella circina FSU 941]